MAVGNLILTGFMGMGKSTVGRKSAELLKVPYNDTDDWMETNAGINIPELVRTDMAKFRELEAETLQTILGETSGIISTGGGIVSTEVGRKALLGSNVPVLWLRAPFEVAEQRVMQDTGRERPLFSDVNKARALYEERMWWYEETANHIIDASQPLALVVGLVVEIAHSELD
jgi:shikimate kinase